MVIGAVVVGFHKECTRELTWEQVVTSKKFKGKIVYWFLYYVQHLYFAISSGYHPFVMHLWPMLNLLSMDPIPTLMSSQCVKRDPLTLHLLVDL